MFLRICIHSIVKARKNNLTVTRLHSGHGKNSSHILPTAQCSSHEADLLRVNFHFVKNILQGKNAYMYTTNLCEYVHAIKSTEYPLGIILRHYNKYTLISRLNLPAIFSETTLLAVFPLKWRRKSPFSNWQVDFPSNIKYDAHIV